MKSIISSEPPCTRFGLFIFGLPGAGKSTLAATLGQQNDFIFISLGSLLRRLISFSSERENVFIARRTVLKGIDAPIELISKLVKQELENKIFKNLVLDAYPKNLSQFAELKQLLFDLGIEDRNILGVYLEATEELVLTRLQHRVVCSICGTPGKDTTVNCPLCGGNYERRIDDEINNLTLQRIQYHKESLTFVPYFEENYRLLCIPAQLDQYTVLEKVNDWLATVS